MKKLKNIVYFIMALVLLSSFFFINSINSIAADDARLTVSTPSAAQNAGDEFDVSVVLDNNPGIVIFVLYLQYDDTRFEFVSVSRGPVLNTQNLDEPKNDIFNGAKAVRVTNGLRTTAIVGNGILYNVRFKVKDNAVSGNYNFSLTYTEGDIVGEPLQPGNRPNNFLPAAVAGTVTIGGSGGSVIDDINDVIGGSLGGTDGTDIAVTGIGDDKDDEYPAIDVTDNTPPLLWTNPYSDVKSTEWFFEAARFVTEYGLMTGTSMANFSPNVAMTRAMLVTVLHNLERKPTVSGDMPFADVREGEWYSNAILWAYQNKITAGYPNGKFGWNDTVTREQAVVILYQYAKMKALDVSASADLSKYTDMNDISDWALNAMKWAAAEGIITGRTATTATPKGITTRAEAASIFKKFIEGFL